MIYAIREQNISLFYYCLFQGMLNDRDCLSNHTPLMICAIESWPTSLTFMELLLRNGARVNDMQHWNHTALYYAVQQGRYRKAKLLLKYKANVNIFDKRTKQSPLHVSMKKGRADIGTLLLKHGCDPNHKDYLKRNALYEACVYGAVDMIEPLLDAGIPIDERCEMIGNRTPLMEACMRISEGENHRNIIKCLLKRGADKTLKNKEGQTAYELAMMTPNKSDPDVQNVIQLVKI